MGSVEISEIHEITAAAAVSEALDDSERREEIANSWTSVLGLALSILGFSYLLHLARATNSSLQIVSSAVYGVSLIVLFAMSTLYHAASDGAWKDRFRLGDHASIYVLIAGSYTPCALIWLSGAWSWTMMVLMWLFAICGVLFKLRYRFRYETLSTLFYVFMGWVGACAAHPLLEVSPLPGLLWMLGGGIVYTVGTIFYVLDDTPYFHAIWHIFVLGGSVCHFVGIVAYVIPYAA